MYPVRQLQTSALWPQLCSSYMNSCSYGKNCNFVTLHNFIYVFKLDVLLCWWGVGSSPFVPLCFPEFNVSVHSLRLQLRSNNSYWLCCVLSQEWECPGEKMRKGLTDSHYMHTPRTSIPFSKGSNVEDKRERMAEPDQSATPLAFLICLGRSRCRGATTHSIFRFYDLP